MENINNLAMIELANKGMYNIIITEKCNLRCKYCYVKNRDTDFHISEETLNKFLNILKTYRYKNDKSKPVKIDLFGGEPLLFWKIVKNFIIKANEMFDENFMIITIYTNAVLLTEEILNFTHQYKNVNYNFSVDGNKECHDSQRIFENGSGSYDKVMNGIQNYENVYHNKKAGMFVVAPANYQYLFDVVKTSVKNNTRVHSSIDRTNWSKEELDGYKKEFFKTIDYLISFPVDEIVNFIDMGLVYPLIDKVNNRSGWCSIGKNSVSISPKGDIYPCQRFYNNNSNFIIGNLDNGIELENSIYLGFKYFTYKNSTKCSKCEMSPGCVGQCFGASFENNGNMFEPIDSVCEIIKFKYKGSLLIFDRFKDNLYFKNRVENLLSGGGVTYEDVIKYCERTK